MSRVNDAAENIIRCINEETADLDNNERAMVLLFVSGMAKCAVQLDFLDTLMPTRRKEDGDGR